MDIDKEIDLWMIRRLFGVEVGGTIHGETMLSAWRDGNGINISYLLFTKA